MAGIAAITYRALTAAIETQAMVDHTYEVEASASAVMRYLLEMGNEQSDFLFNGGESIGECTR